MQSNRDRADKEDANCCTAMFSDQRFIIRTEKQHGSSNSPTGLLVWSPLFFQFARALQRCFTDIRKFRGVWLFYNLIVTICQLYDPGTGWKKRPRLMGKPAASSSDWILIFTIGLHPCEHFNRFQTHRLLVVLCSEKRRGILAIMRGFSGEVWSYT